MEPAANILHADLDAFYASVEQLLNPDLRGKPIAVGGGVVLAASYEAKAFGVRGGMSGRKARELCPQLIFVGGHFSEYQRLGDAAIAILGDFTPLVERISIDEAFADVTGCTHLFGSPAEIAAEIRRRVRDRLGLPISVGVARTKHLAKIASQVAKPDGLVVVDPVREIDFLHPLPVGLMWGVGPVTEARLKDQGILTIGQLAKTPGRSLERLLGPAAGEKLSHLAWNRDPRAIRTKTRARSAGAQSALGRKPATEAVFKPAIRHLADRVASRLRAKALAGRTITVRVRFRPIKELAEDRLDSRGRVAVNLHAVWKPLEQFPEGVERDAAFFIAADDNRATALLQLGDASEHRNTPLGDEDLALKLQSLGYDEHILFDTKNAPWNVVVSVLGRCEAEPVNFSIVHIGKQAIIAVGAVDIDHGRPCVVIFDQIRLPEAENSAQSDLAMFVELSLHPRLAAELGLVLEYHPFAVGLEPNHGLSPLPPALRH